MPLTPAILSNDDSWIGTHITFDFDAEQSSNKKTCVWEVNEKRGQGTLGEIRWFARWRKYAFFPAAGSLYEEVCLTEVAEFLVWATNIHKQGP